MSTYIEHADHEGLAQRLAVLASRADRETMLRTLQERDIGCVTLTMRKDELRARRREARAGFVPPMTWAPCLLAEEG
jgi:hypothetical protein